MARGNPGISEPVVFLDLVIPLPGPPEYRVTVRVPQRLTERQFDHLIDVLVAMKDGIAVTPDDMASLARRRYEIEADAPIKRHAATCEECDPTATFTFATPGGRQEWLTDHLASTGHHPHTGVLMPKSGPTHHQEEPFDAP